LAQGTLDLSFVGDASPDKLGGPKSLWEPSVFCTQLLASLGERALGLEAAQLLAATKWLQQMTGAQLVRMNSTGIRSQVIALVASALQPTTYSELLVREGMRSFAYLLEKPVAFQDAPDLFCLDLYKEFDIADLTTLAQPPRWRLKVSCAIESTRNATAVPTWCRTGQLSCFDPRNPDYQSRLQ